MLINAVHTIVIHASATKPSMNIGAEEITAWHKARGWRTIGYHKVIRRDGIIENGRALDRQGAHVRGNNVNTWGICVVGGINEQTGKPETNYTWVQCTALKTLLRELLVMGPAVTKIMGHRDFSPDLNGDGIIEEFEWTKACPCFDVAERLLHWGWTSLEEVRNAVQ